MIRWLRDLRRRKLLAAPFPEAWLGWLSANVPYYEHLSPEEQAALRDRFRIFVAERYWEGCGGLELTDEIKVTVAAQACLLTLHLPDEEYANVRSLFIYPSGYRMRSKRVGPAGIVTESTDYRLGEAWQDGPVVLSWQDAREGGRNPADGRNVVLHEFAHKLDMGNGRADGVPRLPDDATYDRWVRVMDAEYGALAAASASGQPALLDIYAAEGVAEFFAIATELFFERAVETAARHPRLYALLRDYYRQDPAARRAA